VYTESIINYERKCAHAEIKERANEISMCAEEDRFNFFYQLSCYHVCQISEQQKTLSGILLSQKKIVGALSEIREHT